MDNLGSPEPALVVGHWKECLESLHLKSSCLLEKRHQGEVYL